MAEKLTMKYLESEIKKIQERNAKVEADKAWETSTQRKISVAIITYIVVLVVMHFLGFDNIFLWAIIPTAWYLLSTLGVHSMKKIYLKKYLNK